MAISGTEEEKGEVYHGHEICMSKAAELLQACSLPLGLLPLDAVEKCGINRDTGFVWIDSKKETKHYFNLAGRMTKYGTKITARASKGKLSDVRGVKAKEMFMWMDVHEIFLDAAPNNTVIHFKALAGIIKTYPVEAFAPGQ